MTNRILIKIMVLIVVTLILVPLKLYAQSTPKIRQLEVERKELHKRITESESMLKAAGNDVKSQLSNLALITGQIEERRQYLSSLQKEAHSIELEIKRLENEMAVLKKNLEKKQERYSRTLRQMQASSGIEEKLMFILSAENFSQMFRRMRYVRQYAQFQRIQGEQVKDAIKQIEAARKISEEAYSVKLSLLEHHEEEKKKLESQEAERRDLLASMQNKQIQIRKELEKQRQKANLLSAEIDRLIAAEIEAARKREEERQKMLQKQKKQTEKTGETEKKQPIQQVAKPDYKLAATFEQNKGRLPVPVTGPYVLVGRYGQYQVSGLRNVRLDNKGVDIKAKSGAMARLVFDGEVTAVFQYGGLANVLVRHGSYISVYCNLESVIVKQGSQLKACDVIGQIHNSPEDGAVLHFQLRKETSKLNPELWVNF